MMPETEFEHQQRNPDDKQSHQVRNQKSTTAIAIGHVRESPNIAQTDGGAESGKQKTGTGIPSSAFHDVLYRKDPLDRTVVFGDS